MSDDLLNRKLKMILESKQRFAITRQGAYPPCFDGLEQYESWLSSSDPEMGSKPPPRTGWPGEPNYCRDCNPEYHKKMRRQKRCLFPSTKFVVSGKGEDEEVIGV